MLEFIESVRGVYNGGQKTLTFTVPSDVQKGDLLVALIVRDAAYSGGPPGWTMLDSNGSSPEILDTWAHIVVDDEPENVTFTTTVSHEMQGVMLRMRGSTPLQLLESRGDQAFVATMTPTAPATGSQQAINLVVYVWSSSGAPVFTPPAGLTLIDTFSTAVVAARALLVAYRVCNTTFVVPSQQATTNINATGRAFFVLWRDHPPLMPIEIVDSVPGNHGLMETSQ